MTIVACAKRRVDRWSPEAIEAREEARGRLAAALHLLAYRHGRAECPDDPARGMRHGSWLMRRRRVLECGSVAVAYARPSPTAAPVPVLGPSGVPISLVSHCGARIGCPDCASRAAARNTARLRDALAEVRETEARARRGLLALSWWRSSQKAERALDEVLRLSGVRDVRVRPVVGAHGVELEGPTDAIGCFAELRRVDVLRDLPSDLMPEVKAKDTRVGVCPMVADAKWSSRRARRRAERAEQQEDRLKRMEQAERACALSRAAVRRAYEVPDVDDDTDPVPGLHARDAERWSSVLARQACGDRRAARTYERLRAEALARLARRRQRVIDHAEADHADALRRRSAARRALSLARVVRARDLRFVTFTQRRIDGESAADAIERLTSSLRRLARSKQWRQLCAGATWKVEAEWSSPDTRRQKAHQQLALAEREPTKADALRESAERLLASSSWSTSGAGWHVHAHCLVATGYVDHAELRALWQRASGTVEAGVNIQRPGRRIEHELAKYVSKPLVTRTLKVVEVADLVQGIEGRRLMWTTGGMRRCRLVEADELPATTIEGEEAVDGDIVGVAGFRPIRRDEVRGGISLVDIQQGDLPGLDMLDGDTPRRRVHPHELTELSWRAVEWRGDELAQAVRLSALRTIDRARQAA